MNNYLIESSDTKLTSILEDKVIKDNKFNDTDISIYDLDEESLSSPLEDLDTYGLFSQKKVIIIRNIQLVKADDKELLHLFKYLDNSNPDNLLIIDATKLDGKTKMSKELKKKCRVVSNSINTRAYIKNKLKDFKIDDSVISLIDSICGDDIGRIDNECNKLINYCDASIITSSDVNAIVCRTFEERENAIFDFSRSLALKNKKNSLELLKELAIKNEAYSLIGMIASQFRIMLQVKLLENGNMSYRDIANRLSEKEFRIKKTMEVTRLYSVREIEDLIIKLEDIDLKSKSTDVSPIGLIEEFIINM